MALINKDNTLFLGRSKTVDAMKNISYQTFSTIINEDYDNEDDYKMLNIIIGEIYTLCNLTTDELSNFLIEAKRITAYNFKLLCSKKSEIITDL
jgi:hypothetical protein